MQIGLEAIFNRKRGGTCAFQPADIFEVKEAIREELEFVDSRNATVVYVRPPSSSMMLPSAHSRHRDGTGTLTSTHQSVRPYQVVIYHGDDIQRHLKRAGQLNQESGARMEMKRLRHH